MLISFSSTISKEMFCLNLPIEFFEVGWCVGKGYEEMHWLSKYEFRSYHFHTF